MKLMLHTFKKDVHRFWPGGAVSLGLLAVLAVADRWRFDSVAGATEGWLNLVLPLAWACLMALAVLEEPLAGDRHFWLTRPHRWGALLGAKSLFAVLFVHLPCLMADAYVVAAHGFSPLASLPQLLWKQLALAAFLTLPALALSSMIQSFTHFMMGVFAIGAATVFSFASSQSHGVYVMMRQDDFLRNEVAAFLIAAGSLAILWLQYRRRPAILARGVGYATALLAAALIALVPWQAEFRARVLLRPARTPVTLRIDPRSPNSNTHYWSSAFALPMALSGLPAGTTARAALLSLTMIGPDGRRYESALFTPGGAEKAPLEAVLYPDSPTPFDPPPDPQVAAPPPLCLSLRLDPAVYAALKDRNVRLTGQTAVSVVRLGETAWMPVGGRVAAPGAGHCSNGIGEDRGSEDRLKVLCESPSDMPSVVRVMLWTPEDRVKSASPPRLGIYGNYSGGPQVSWLSPLDRGMTSFGLSDPRYRRRSNFGGVPMERLGHARIGVIPEVVTGYSVTNFDIPDVSLSKYWVEPRTY